MALISHQRTKPVMSPLATFSTFVLQSYSQSVFLRSYLSLIC